MISFTTWRQVYRIPWLRKNKEAVRILSDMFYLLIALYRTKRMQEFSRLSHLYFKMIDSFAQFGRIEAEDTLNQVLQISWFQENRRDVYRLIAAYKRVIAKMNEDGNDMSSVSSQIEINRDIKVFFLSLKSLIHFDEQDEGRVKKLLERIDIDDTLIGIHQTLGY